MSEPCFGCLTRNIDNATAMIHHSRRLPSEEKGSREVHADDALPFLQTQFGQWLDDVANGGVIDENIQTTKVRDGSLYCCTNRGFMRDIAGDAHSVIARVDQVAHDRVVIRGMRPPACHDAVEVRHNELAPRLAQALENAVSQSAFPTCACAQRYLAFETLHSIDSVTMNVASSANSLN